MNDYIYATGFWVAVIAAVSSAAVSVINGYYSAKRGAVAVATASDAAVKVGEVHTMLNSEKAAMQAKLDAQQEQVKLLMVQVAQLSAKKG